MSNVSYILAQILGMTATILLCSSYFVKNKTTFLIISFFGDLIYGLTFILVSSWSAGIISVLSLMQYLFILHYEKKSEKIPKSVAISFISCYVIVGLITFKSMWDIVPILTYIWFTIALYLKDLNKIRFMCLIANMLLAVYDVMVTAYSNALEDGIEAIIILSVIVITLIQSKNNVKRKYIYSATLSKGKQLACDVIGVDKHFDLQSVTSRMLRQINHDKYFSPATNYANIDFFTCQYG